MNSVRCEFSGVYMYPQYDLNHQVVEKLIGLSLANQAQTGIGLMVKRNSAYFLHRWGQDKCPVSFAIGFHTSQLVLPGFLQPYDCCIILTRDNVTSHDMMHYVHVKVCEIGFNSACDLFGTVYKPFQQVRWPPTIRDQRVTLNHLALTFILRLGWFISKLHASIRMISIHITLVGGFNPFQKY